MCETNNDDNNDSKTRRILSRMQSSSSSEWMNLMIGWGCDVMSRMEETMLEFACNIQNINNNNNNDLLFEKSNNNDESSFVRILKKIKKSLKSRLASLSLHLVQHYHRQRDSFIQYYHSNILQNQQNHAYNNNNNNDENDDTMLDETRLIMQHCCGYGIERAKRLLNDSSTPSPFWLGLLYLAFNTRISSRILIQQQQQGNSITPSTITTTSTITIWPFSSMTTATATVLLLYTFVPFILPSITTTTTDDCNDEDKYDTRTNNNHIQINEKTNNKKRKVETIVTNPITNDENYSLFINQQHLETPIIKNTNKRTIIQENDSPQSQQQPWIVVTDPFNQRATSKNDRSDSLGSMPSFAASSQSSSQQPQPEDQEEEHHLELLVYNISHADLVFSLAFHDSNNDIISKELQHDDNDNESLLLCRPRFSTFDKYCRRILTFLQQQQQSNQKTNNMEISPNQIMSFPRFQRTTNDDAQHVVVRNDEGEPEYAPTGIQLSSKDNNSFLNITHSNRNDLRIRGRDAQWLQQQQNTTGDNTSLSLSGVYFPLIATLLPKWLKNIQEKYNTTETSKVKVDKVIVLVTGVGMPRNAAHAKEGNSTLYCAHLLKSFLQCLYPNDEFKEIVTIHSSWPSNLFRYNDNLLFCQFELLPRIHSYTTTMKKQQQDDNWKNYFHVTIACADGSSARTHAIQVALRQYRPTLAHFWQLKSFWHETRIFHNDVELHSFQEMEMAAIDTMTTTMTNHDMPCLLNQDELLVVNEMKQFRNDFLNIITSGNNKNNKQQHDLESFWLRKTGKPVLSVLLVRDNNNDKQQQVLYRGTNMEVSMPTGSLCAERNVIGTALASNPSLCRRDLLMIAVLAMPQFHKQRHNNNNGDCCNMCMSTTQQQQQQECNQNDKTNDDSWVVSYCQELTSPPKKVATTSPTTTATSLSSPQSDCDSSTSSGRRTTIYAPPPQVYNNTVMLSNDASWRKRTVPHSKGDINPLRPCGACNEWLKKISESNPNFKVITFTDSECRGVYVNSIQDY